MFRTSRESRCCVACRGMFLFVLVAGCGSSASPPKGPPIVKVNGVVIYQGKPVPNANVTFFPEGQGESAAGLTQEDGRFFLSTYVRKDGAVIGSHVVTVVVPPSEPVLPGMEAALKKSSPIPAAYLDRSTSKLHVEVKPGVANEFELVLTD